MSFLRGIVPSFAARPGSSRRRYRVEPTVAPACERLEERMLLSGVVPGVAEDEVYATTHILVGFDQGASPDAAAPALEGTKLGDVVSSELGLYQVYLDPGVSVADAVAAYGAAENVAFAQPDYQVQVHLTPNDPRYSSLWGLSKIGAPTAWDSTTGSSDIVVGIIDTGIDYNHQDLAANIWSNSDETAGNGIDDDGNGFVDDVRGWDFYNNDNNPMDDHSHGTHVAGTVGAVGNNSVGVVGVNWKVKLMPLKFLGRNGSGSTSDAVKAVNYARQNGADVINASWGGGGFNTALNNAIQAYHNAGGIFVAAAGNSGRNNDSSAHYPSNYNNVVGVAATDSSDRLASFSNYGTGTVDIAAPGVGILSTTPGNRYASYSGTSMAAPHVAGAMALVWAKNPTWTNSQVISKVYDSAKEILTTRVKHGRLDLAKAIGSGGQTDAQGPRVTNAVWSGSQSGTLNKVRLTFNEAIKTSTFDTGDVALTGPGGGSISVQSVAAVGTSNTIFDVSFASQSAAGTYKAVVGPNITDTKDNLMNQDGDGTNGEATQDQFTTTSTISATKTYSWTGSARIRDRRTTRIRLAISDNVTIDDVDVKVRIQHTWDSDLGVALIAPNGRGRWLIYRRGGSGDNIYATFNDEASTHISRGAAPFNGSFRPESSLSYFDGMSTNGTWQLYVRDYVRGDTGRIREFTMTVKPRAGTSGSSIAELDPALPAEDPTRLVVPVELATADAISNDSAIQQDTADEPVLTLEEVDQPGFDELTTFEVVAGEFDWSEFDAVPDVAPIPTDDLDAVFGDFYQELHDVLATV